MAVIDVYKENARLLISMGITNPKLGITPDMEVGHLYHLKNDIDELAGLGRMIGLSPSWILNRVKGLAHYDVWGAPLKDARRLVRVVTREEAGEDYSRMTLEYDKYVEDTKRGVELEVKSQDSIRMNLGYVHFVSKSKGRGRRRRNWKEIELYRFAGGGRDGEWHTAKRAHFDTMTEIMSERMRESSISGDDLMNWAKEHCDRKGGKAWGIV